jgi:tetratricopeptide (TPR) repeat protein
MLGSYPLVEYDDVMRAYYVTRLNNMKLSDGTNRLNIRAVWRRAYFKSGNPLSKAAKFNIAILFLVFVGVSFYFSMELNHHMMYEKATKFYNEGDYEEAFRIFSELNSYKKSDFMVEKCVEGMHTSDNYAAAKRLYNDGDYTAAIAIFNSMSSYKDSHQLKLECSRIISEKYDKVYLEAESLYNAGKYEKALMLYDVLFGYKDSHVKSMRCEFFLSE